MNRLESKTVLTAADWWSTHYSYAEKGGRSSPQARAGKGQDREVSIKIELTPFMFSPDGVYYLKFQGSEFGPYSSEEANRILESKRLNGPVHFRRKDSRQWFKVRNGF